MRTVNTQIKELLNKKSHYEINKRNLNEDHLKEGIGSYIYTKPPKKINPDIFINKKKYSKIKYESNAYYITQRVLYPDKDILKPKPCTKRILSVEKNSKHYKDGLFKSLIDKTPTTFQIQKRNDLNRSYDNIKRGHDIFLRNKFEDKNAQRIFGVERKRIDKHHNYESDCPKFKFFKRFFFEKAVNNKQIYL